jgi:hypothetical protein
MSVGVCACHSGPSRASDPSANVSWDAAGGVGLRLDKDEW